MTGRAPGPTSKEIREVGEILAKYGGKAAREALALYRNGSAPWDGALRAVRTQIREMQRQTRHGSNFPISARDALTAFAAKYGTETRATSTGTEPLTVKNTMRWAPADWAAVMAAAEKQGITSTEFVRNAAVMAAQKEGQQTHGL